MSMSLPRSTLLADAAGAQNESPSSVARTSEQTFIFIADNLPRLLQRKWSVGRRPGFAPTPRFIGEKSPPVNEQNPHTRSRRGNEADDLSKARDRIRLLTSAA